MKHLFYLIQLGKKYLGQQTIWADIKAKMSYYFFPHNLNTSTKIWLLEMNAKRNTSWLIQNIHTQNDYWEKLHKHIIKKNEDK